MSIQVNSLDVYGLEEKLRKSDDPLVKEAWHYIKQLKEALKRQQELTAKAIQKLREK
jgi:hypothetical protein